MRGVSTRVRRGGALLVLLVALGGSVAYGEEAPGPSDEARARPPIGVTSAAQRRGFFAWLQRWVVSIQARAQPPIG